MVNRSSYNKCGTEQDQGRAHNPPTCCSLAGWLIKWFSEISEDEPWCPDVTVCSVPWVKEVLLVVCSKAENRKRSTLAKDIFAYVLYFTLIERCSIAVHQLFIGSATWSLLS